MKVQKFEKYIDHLSQRQVTEGAVHTIVTLLQKNEVGMTGKVLSALNKVLIRCGIATEEAIQAEFMTWMKDHDLLKNQ